MTRIFFDMDGVLAEYRQVEYECMLEKGYFYNLKPQAEVIEAMKKLAEDPEIEVHTLSAVIEESEYALYDKQDWLEDNISFLDKIKINYLFCGENKAEAVPGGIRPTDILIDDYNPNLRDWESRGVAVKYLNGINHKHKSWKGLAADGAGLLDTIYSAIGRAPAVTA